MSFPIPVRPRADNGVLQTICLSPCDDTTPKVNINRGSHLGNGGMPIFLKLFICFYYKNLFNTHPPPFSSHTETIQLSVGMVAPNTINHPSGSNKSFNLLATSNCTPPTSFQHNFSRLLTIEVLVGESNRISKTLKCNLKGR